MTNRFFILIVSLQFYINSCQSNKFIVNEYNKIVDNICEKGVVTYYANETITSLDSSDNIIKNECNISLNLLRLNKIIPNKSFNKENCEFVITFEYLEQMEKYIEKTNKYRKINYLDYETYRDTLNYFDSLQVIIWEKR